MGSVNCTSTQNIKIQNQGTQIIQQQQQQQQSQKNIQQYDYSTNQNLKDNNEDPLTQFLCKDFLNTQIKASSDLMNFNDQNAQMLFSKARRVLNIKKHQLIDNQQQIKYLKQFNNNSQQICKEVSDFLVRTETGKKQSYTPIRVKIENFIKIKKQSISSYYQLSSKIGQGAFGSVYKARCLKSNQLRAVKVLKQKKMPQGQRINLLAQIDLLKKLDHPHIIKLYDLFLFNNFYYVVTQYCEGGSVLGLVKAKLLNGVIIMKIMRQLMNALFYLHNQEIAHRDLKLQNIVILKPIDKENCQDLDIKLIDFGLASAVQRNKMKKTGHVGTYQYMAPQIIKGSYNEKCDVWSCGVILFALLVGKMPFQGINHQQTITQIVQKQINFQDLKYKKIDDDLKNLLKHMLQKNPIKRISIFKVLQFKCFKDSSQKQIRISGQAIMNLQKYYKGNNFVTVVESYLSFRKINQEQRKQLASIFNSIDKDRSGTIQIQQLKDAYRKVTGVQNSSQVQQIINKIDFDKSGKIDFSEFLIAMYSRQKLFDQKSLLQAFEHFDTDKTGYLQKRQIKQALAGCKKSQIKNIFEMLDKDGDQRISKQQFLNYLLAY